MNLAFLLALGTPPPRPAPLEPGAGSSTRATPMLPLTPEELGLGLSAEEQARMARDLDPGPPNRKQRRAAARRMR